MKTKFTIFMRTWRKNISKGYFRGSLFFRKLSPIMNIVAPFRTYFLIEIHHLSFKEHFCSPLLNMS